jgi:hypothetical protein
MLVVAAVVIYVSLFRSAGSVQAQYPTPTPGCECTLDANCVGTGCKTGKVLDCELQCDPNYRAVEMLCGNTSCGSKCILEQSCVTGYCQGDTCIDIEGTFLCGGGGCNGCQRFVKETICAGDHCQSWCTNLFSFPQHPKPRQQNHKTENQNHEHRPVLLDKVTGRGGLRHHRCGG